MNQNSKQTILEALRESLKNKKINNTKYANQQDLLPRQSINYPNRREKSSRPKKTIQAAKIQFNIAGLTNNSKYDSSNGKHGNLSYSQPLGQIKFSYLLKEMIDRGNDVYRIDFNQQEIISFNSYVKYQQMRKLYKKKHENTNDLTPWLLQNQSSRSQFDQSHFRSITLLHPNQKTSSPLVSNHQKNNNQSKNFAGKYRNHSFHGKTLSNIKDYYKKHYTQQPESFIQNSKVVSFKNIQEHKIKLLSRIRKQISFKQTSIIDLTRSLNENILQNVSKTVILHRDQNREHSCNRIIKIKQDMIRNKQRRKIDKRQQIQVREQLRPQSKSLPMRVKSPKKSQKTLAFPDKNFGNLLCQFLEKI